MLRAAFENIKNQVEVRKNLIQLKELLREDATKNSHNREALLYVMSGDYHVLTDLLSYEDPKVRKNAALILGELGVNEFLDLLYESYQKETQLFVKSSYLSAILGMEHERLLPKLKQQYEQLLFVPITSENKKHMTDELRLLEQLLDSGEEHQKHRFTGYECMNELVLLCNRNHIHVTMEQLGNIAKKEFAAGVMVKTNQLRDVLKIRTYRDLLFAVDGMKTIPNDVVAAAKMLSDGTILDFLKGRHSKGEVFHFRLEVKTKMDAEHKNTFIKRLASEIEHLSERKLLNSVNRYEFEIRLIENKEGRFNVLLRLFTFVDHRFDYRKEVIATSIHPSNAALCAMLAKPYLKEEAQVLDPFCGVGTMLIERNYVIPARTMYGMDVFGEAIEKARVNTKAANLIVNYINRDFFDFKHEYLFDEIITNMPVTGQAMSERNLYELYERFFEKAKQHLNDQAVLVLYTHNRNFVKKLGNRAPYRIEKEFEISMMEGTYVFILRYTE